jgi:putative membrane protein
MMRHLTLTSCILLAIFALQGCRRDRNVEAARENRPPSASPAAQDFMMKTAEADLSEIDMARLALQTSSNAEIRDYAKMIQSEHTTALEALRDLMKDKGVSQPQVASADARQDIRGMSGLSGPEFDREFINTMVADHQKAVDSFHDQIAITQDPDVMKYAEDLSPRLKMHLEKAERLQSKLFRMPG